MSAPLAHEILLLHEAGPDRRALASYLERQGLPTTVCDETRQALAHLGRDGALPNTLVLAHQKRVAAAPKSAIDALRAHSAILIVPSDSEPLPGFQQMVREPFFLDQLVKVIRSNTTRAEAQHGPAEGAPKPRVPDPDLLRGIAHAINNPLTAALGWLRLLETEIEERDRRKRLASQARAELERLGHLSQALALVANPPPANAAFDLGHLVATRVNEAQALGARVVLRHAPTRTFQVVGNPLEYDLLLRLVLATAHDSQSLDVVEVSITAAPGGVQLAFNDPKAVAPDHDSLADLGRLLRVERHHRAVAIALAQSIAAREGGSLRCEPLHPRGASFLLSIPEAAKPLESAQGSP